MAQTTQKYSRSMAGSIGAGMKSLMGNDGRRYFVLEHKVSSKYHKAGENQRIIVDQIELGRDPKCQVRFDESFGTVSRRHAAIVRDGDNWKLVQLSQTNSTYLNGHRVEKEWYLQNGDEIQLSTNGPKMGFIVPQGEQGLVKSIGLTARMSLFRQQALRPYKQALTALSCIFVVALFIGSYFVYGSMHENKEQRRIIADMEKAIEIERKKTANAIDSLLHVTHGLLADINTRNAEINKLKHRVSEIESKPITVSSGTVDNNAIDKCLPYVFYIQTVGFEIKFPDGTQSQLSCSDDAVPGWSGTGFLLTDGRFITARHVIEGWNFWQDGGGTNEKLAILNLIANNNGSVVAHFMAVSSCGTQLSFTSNQFTINKRGDQSFTTEDGQRMSLSPLDDTDYAVLNTNKREGLKYNSNKSTRLKRGTPLTVLGFPLGLGANAINDINPILGSGIAAADGLQRGRILTTDTNYEQGNSGGPVFYTNDNGDLEVIGIVSAGAGRSTGFVVPISVIQ